MLNLQRFLTESRSQTLYFDHWAFSPSRNSLTDLSRHSTVRLEPKVSLLLRILLQANGEVMTREQLCEAIWHDTIVSEDSLAKTVSRLRFSLSDSASEAQYIETIPKVGYRFVVPLRRNNALPLRALTIIILVAVCAIAIFALTFMQEESGAPVDEASEKLTRADELYMQYQISDNEAALAFYEEVLAVEPENVHALAGAANAMLQRTVRWSSTETAQGVSLSHALQSGKLATPEAQLMLERARLMAEKAIKRAPDNPVAMKALAFAYSAEGRVVQAIELYKKAIAMDSAAWRSHLNLSELYQINQQTDEAMSSFENAFYSMQLAFDEEPHHIGHWQPLVGVMLGHWYAEQGEEETSRQWAKRVLDIVPFHPEASAVYVNSLLREEKLEQAEQFCDQYARKLISLGPCSAL